MKKACFFHYTQNIYRRAQKIGAVEYGKRGSFHSLCKSLMVLPLIPVKRIMEAFKYIKSKYRTRLERKMITYFEANYIKGKYKPIIWNVSELETRTNNAVESFNSMFNRMVRISHPPINEFIRQLYVVIDDIHLKATKAVNENQLPRVKKIQEKRIKQSKIQ